MDFLSPKAKALVPYVAGEQPRGRDFIKLNTNENPYPPSPSAVAAARDFDYDKLRKYPDPQATELCQAISSVYGVGADNVFVGNGSDEVLALCFAAFFEGESIAFADITYSFYPVYSAMYNVNKVIVPLKGLQMDVEGFINCAAKGVIIANPNAPTSVALPRAEAERLVKICPNKLIIVDEAYADFCEESVTDLVNIYPNLIVVRTFSKSYSLAGIRCGYALANKELVAGLNRVKDSFNSYTTGFLTQIIATAALLDREYYQQKRESVIKTRNNAVAALRNAGYSVADSAANFLYITHPKAQEVYLKLKEQGILVRYFKSLPDRLRVTVGTDEETAAFIAALCAIDRATIEGIVKHTEPHCFIVQRGATYILLYRPYLPYPAEEDCFFIDGYYLASHALNGTTKVIVADLNAAGYAAKEYEGDLKGLFTALGAAQRLRNGLVAIEGEGSFFALSAIKIGNAPDSVIPKPVVMCENCGACAAVCPTRALDDFDFTRCVRSLQNNIEKAMDYLDKIGNSIQGCNACALVCPKNAAKLPAVTGATMPQTLKNVLQYDSFIAALNNGKSALEPLAELIGANFVRPRRHRFFAVNSLPQSRLDLLDSIVTDDPTTLALIARRKKKDK